MLEVGKSQYKGPKLNLVDESQKDTKWSKEELLSLMKQNND